jgi:transcription antitermination factor NusG
MVGGTDQRDSYSWVVLELTRAGESKVEDGDLERLLRETLRVEASHPVFIPSMTYTNRGRRVTIHLMEGYVFVASGLRETEYLALESSCPYIRRVLTSRGPSGMRVLSVVPDSKIADMRMQLAQQVSSDITEGMRVIVTDGTYSRLDGDVIEVEKDGDSAHVRFVLRSLDLIARIPRVFLSPADEEES